MRFGNFLTNGHYANYQGDLNSNLPANSLTNGRVIGVMVRPDDGPEWGPNGTATCIKMTSLTIYI